MPQGLLNINHKLRSNFFPWNGQFSPQLIEVLLRSFAPEYGNILDPFAGSGTVLHEAAALGLPVVGSEINPAAYMLARIYCLMNQPISRRKEFVGRLGAALGNSLPDPDRSLFNVGESVENSDFKQALVELHRTQPDSTPREMLESLIVLVDFHKELTPARIYGAWAKLQSQVMGLPEVASPIRLFNCDARRLPLSDDEVDFVVTSPPYLNVFNYHQQYRTSVESLAWNLLAVARSEIGANRKHRQNRFLTVIQYCLDMADVLRELQRVCRQNARMVLVLGRESNVRKTRFFNGEIVATLATRCLGFPIALRQERFFQNRFGVQIVEDILHLDVRKGEFNGLSPRMIGQEALRRAKQRAPQESLADLEEACGLSEEVQASPVFERDTASNRSQGRKIEAITS